MPLRWVLNACVGTVKWAWSKGASIGNVIVDPAPRTIKALFWVIAGVMLAGWLVGDVALRWLRTEMSYSGTPIERFLDTGIVTTSPLAPPQSIPQKAATKVAEPKALVNAVPKPERKKANKTRVAKAKPAPYWPY